MVYQPEMPAEAIEFFALFARWEYAMKAEGLRQVNQRGDVSANWAELEKRDELAGIIEVLAGNEAAKYLLQHPPKKQAIINEQLGWGPAPNQIATINDLSVMIRRVRNNLFHGSKSVPSTERDTKLMRACTAVIREMAQRLPDLQGRLPPEG